MSVTEVSTALDGRSRFKRVSVFVSAGASFAPTDISGLVAWYKADSEAYNDNDPVGTATDRSGSGRDLTEATTKPTFKTNILNGKPVYRFDGVDDKLKTASFTLNQPTTWFVVCKMRSAAGSDQRPIDGGTSLTALLQSNPDGHYHLYAGTHLAAAGDSPTSFHYLSYIFNGASSQLWQDGVSKASGDAGTANLAGGLWVGNGESQPAPLDLAELLIYNSALNATDRGNVQTYLAGKYAL